MIGFEEQAKIALLLHLAADALGHAVACVEEMGRRDIETIRAEDTAADTICIAGPELIRALRTLARRYVR